MSRTASLILAISALSACGKTVDLGDDPARPDPSGGALRPLVGGAALWVDGEHVYWITVHDPNDPSTVGEFGACAKATCAETTVFSRTTPSYPRAMSLGGNEPLYATYEAGRFTIERCIDGCEQTEPVLRTRSTHVWSGIAADDRFVFWESNEGIYRCPFLQYCDLPELWRRTGRSYFMDWHYLVDAGDWVVSVAVPAPSKSYSSVAVRKDGSAEVREAFRGALPDLPQGKVSAFPDIVAVGPAFIVSSEFGISFCETPDCDLEEDIIAPGVITRSLEADATHLYWLAEPTRSASGAFRCEIADCGRPDRLAAVPADAVAIALDATHLWWITPTSLGRVAK